MPRRWTPRSRRACRRPVHARCCRPRTPPLEVPEHEEQRQEARPDQQGQLPRVDGHDHRGHEQLSDTDHEQKAAPLHELRRSCRRRWSPWRPASRAARLFWVSTDRSWTWRNARTRRVARPVSLARKIRTFIRYAATSRDQHCHQRNQAHPSHEGEVGPAAASGALGRPSAGPRSARPAGRPSPAAASTQGEWQAVADLRRECQAPPHGSPRGVCGAVSDTARRRGHAHRAIARRRASRPRPAPRRSEAPHARLRRARRR